MPMFFDPTPGERRVLDSIARQIPDVQRTLVRNHPRLTMPDRAAQFVEERGAHIVALNCGTGMDMNGAAMVAKIYRESCNLPAMVQPNAGLPVLENMKAVYKQLPADMALGVPAALQAGANIIGSCCGSTPDHTRAIRQVVEQFNRK